MREYGTAIFLGGLGGAAIALGIWWYASRALDQQLAQGGSRLSTGIAEGRATLESRLRQGELELQARIRTEVRSAMDQRLTEANITPETGTRLSRLLNAAEAAGLLR